MVSSKDNVISYCLIIISAIMVMATLFLMRSVLIPFVFSLFLFFVISPLIDYSYTRLKVPKALSVSITLILLILVLFLFILILGISLKGFIQDSGEYQLKLLTLVDNVNLYFNQYGYTVDLSVIRQALIELPILKWVSHFSGGLVGFLGNIVLVFIFTLFLIIGEKLDRTPHFLSAGIQTQITRYLTTKFFTSTLTGILVGAILMAFHVQLAIMFAVLTIFLNFIPTIGSIMATLLPVPVLLLQFGTSWPFFVIVISCGIIQFVIGNIIDPKLMGENLGIHPVVVLLSLLFWGFIWGIPGMFLSVPMTCILKLIFSRFPKTKWVSNLLEGHLS